MILDHIGFPVSDYQRAKEFYQKALAPLGITLMHEISAELTGGEAHCGFGRDGKPDFWISSGAKVAPSLHVAFVAADRQSVDRFYQAAIAAGGADNGAPGLRPIYHPNYYGAFVRDPDGHNIEAVCHHG